jgi:hypothetical protein
MNLSFLVLFMTLDGFADNGRLLDTRCLSDGAEAMLASLGELK